MVLIKFSQTWDILLIYCNNLVRRALYIPLLMSVSEVFSAPFLTLIKLFYTKALEWSSLVPDPKAKSFSLEITNRTSFTISCHSHLILCCPLLLSPSPSIRVFSLPCSLGCSQEAREFWGDTIQHLVCSLVGGAWEFWVCSQEFPSGVCSVLPNDLGDSVSKDAVPQGSLYPS